MFWNCEPLMLTLCYKFLFFSNWHLQCVYLQLKFDHNFYSTNKYSEFQPRFRCDSCSCFLASPLDCDTKHKSIVATDQLLHCESRFRRVASRRRWHESKRIWRFKLLRCDFPSLQWLTPVTCCHSGMSCYLTSRQLIHSKKSHGAKTG
jgi:hypothetical protein